MIPLPVILQDELRANCNCPRRWTAWDFSGMGFGAVMLFAGIQAARRKSIPCVPIVALGATSVLIHAMRFFTSPPLTSLAKK